MSPRFTALSRCWRVAAATLGAVTLVGASFVGSSLVNQARADGGNVSGAFTFVTASPTDCPLPGLCATGAFQGGIQGRFTNNITSLVPSAVPGASFFSGMITIHTASGDLNCGLAGALDTLGKDGEFGEICIVSGGTGSYKKATGHLELTGMSTSELIVVPKGGTGTYTGKVVA
jgi:hypothetical protein